MFLRWKYAELQTEVTWWFILINLSNKAPRFHNKSVRCIEDLPVCASGVFRDFVWCGEAMYVWHLILSSFSDESAGICEVNNVHRKSPVCLCLAIFDGKDVGRPTLASHPNMAVLVGCWIPGRKSDPFWKWINLFPANQLLVLLSLLTCIYLLGQWVDLLLQQNTPLWGQVFSYKHHTFQSSILKQSSYELVIL